MVWQVWQLRSNINVLNSRQALGNFKAVEFAWVFDKLICMLIKTHSQLLY